MLFAHDTEVALSSAAALVNTDPAGGSGEDSLRSRSDLVRFLDEMGWSGARVGDDVELDDVRALRPRLRELWHLEEAPLVRTLNKILAERTGQPLEKIERDTERDYFLSADEAKEYGLVDQVIAKRV